MFTALATRKFSTDVLFRFAFALTKSLSQSSSEAGFFNYSAQPDEIIYIFIFGNTAGGIARTTVFTGRLIVFRVTPVIGILRVTQVDTIEDNPQKWRPDRIQTLHCLTRGDCGCFPSMEDQHHWIEEGLATYVEPIARIQAGQMSADSMWADLVRDMPKGQPQEGDRGLDHTHTWGRTYWGGALFSLVADVAIRKKTGNRKGLQDAMRGILENGGDITEDWPIESALKAGDQAVGVQVLVPLYSEWKDQPVHVDLAALWTELGIDAKANPIRMDDKAPSAEIRRAITSSGPHKPSAESARERSVIAGRKLGPIY